MTRTPVALYGAAGYGGQELLRILSNHPLLRVAVATSQRHAGRPVEAVLPQLEGFYPDLAFQSPRAPLAVRCEAVLLATPHGVSHKLFAALLERDPDLKVVDLSGDFRLHDEARFHAAYGAERSLPSAAAKFAYGSTETNREAIHAARWVANPGCFATGAILALGPLAERGLLQGDVTLAQTTGSSGSGADPKPATHHPERAQDLRAYKVLAHQHEPEVAQELERLGAGGFDLGMVPLSGPFSRGIFTVASLRVDAAVDVAALYRERYSGEFFVRLRSESPALRHVVRTNFCDLSIHRRGERVVVLTAIDNLGKGMATQAVQNLNLILGLDERAGLLAPGANP